MAKKKRDKDLFDHLRARGVRKRVAKVIASRSGNGAKGRKKAESVARGAITDLRSAADAIKDGVIHRDAKRSQAAKKAARTRKRNAEKARRSSAGRKAARTRARAGSR
jgi:hypothetical protein